MQFGLQGQAYLTDVTPMVSLIADLESLGGTIVFNTEFIGAKLNKYFSKYTI